MTDKTTQRNQALPRCPYIYKGGKQCTGHVVRVEAYKADITWQVDENGDWSFMHGEPRSHFHVFCSDKGNHADWGKDDALKFYYRDLPEELRAIVART